MSVGVGFPFMFNSDPCAASPLISSVGATSVNNAGNCAGTDLQFRNVITLSATLTGTGCELQRRYAFSSSATPSYGSWVTIATTGSSYNHDQDVGLYTTDSGVGFGSLGTYYYDVQYRIIGTDGTTVCDGPDAPAQWSGTIYACTA